MTFKIYDNIVHLPYNNSGIIIKDVPYIINNKWNKGILYTNDLDVKKKYNVMIYKISDKSVLLKPLQQYNCRIFEHIFGFGYNCSGFSLEKIINIFK